MIKTTLATFRMSFDGLWVDTVLLTAEAPQTSAPWADDTYYEVLGCRGEVWYGGYDLDEAVRCYGQGVGMAEHLLAAITG